VIETNQSLIKTVTTTGVSKCQVNNLIATEHVKVESEPLSTSEPSKTSFTMQPSDTAPTPSLTITPDEPKTIMEIRFETKDVSKVIIELKKADDTSPIVLEPHLQPDVSSI